MRGVARQTLWKVSTFTALDLAQRFSRFILSGGHGGDGSKGSFAKGREEQRRNFGVAFGREVDGERSECAAHGHTSRAASCRAQRDRSVRSAPRARARRDRRRRSDWRDRRSHWRNARARRTHLRDQRARKNSIRGRAQLPRRSRERSRHAHSRCRASRTRREGAR